MLDFFGAEFFLTLIHDTPGKMKGWNPKSEVWMVGPPKESIW